MALNDLPKHIREPLLEISVKSSSGILMDPHDLLNRLRSSQITNEAFKSLVVSQYEIAHRRRNYKWVEEAKNLIEIFRNYLSIWANRALITPESNRQKEDVRTFHSGSSPVSIISKFQVHQEPLEAADNENTDYYDDYYSPDNNYRQEGRSYSLDDNNMNYSSMARLGGNDKREFSYVTKQSSALNHLLDGGFFDKKNTGRKFEENQPINSGSLTNQGRSREWTSQNISNNDQFLQTKEAKWGQGVGFGNNRLSNTGLSNQSPQMMYSSHNMSEKKSVSYSLQYPMSQSTSSSTGRNFESNDRGFATRQGTIIDTQVTRNELHDEVIMDNMRNEIFDQTPINQVRHDGFDEDQYGYRDVSLDNRLPSDRLSHKSSTNSFRDEEYGQIHKRMRLDHDDQWNIDDNNNGQIPRSTNMFKDISRNHNKGLGDTGPRGYEKIKDTKRQVRKLQKSPESGRKSDRLDFGDERGKLKIQKHVDGDSRSKVRVNHAALQQPNPSDDNFYIDWLESTDQGVDTDSRRIRTRSETDNEINEGNSWVEDKNEDVSGMHQIQKSLTESLSKGLVQMPGNARTIQLQDNNYHGSAIGLKNKIMSCPPKQQGTIITEQELMKRSCNDTVPTMIQTPLMVPGMIVKCLQPMAIPVNQLPLQSGFKHIDIPKQLDMVKQSLQIMPLPGDNLPVQSGFQHMNEPLEPVLNPDNHNPFQSGFQPMNEPFNNQPSSLNIRENDGNARGKNDKKRKSTEMMSNNGKSPRYAREKSARERPEMQRRASQGSRSSRSEQSYLKCNERSTRGKERLTRREEKVGRCSNQGESNKKLRNSILKQFGQFNVVQREQFGQFEAEAKNISEDNFRGHRNLISKDNDAQNSTSGRSYGNLYMNSNKQVADKNKSQVQNNSKKPKASVHRLNNLQSTLMEYNKRKITSVGKKADNRKVLWIIDGKPVPISRRAARRRKAAIKMRQSDQQKSLQHSAPPSSTTNQMVKNQSDQGIKPLNTKRLYTTAPGGLCTTTSKRISTIAPKGTSTTALKQSPAQKAGNTAFNRATNAIDAVRKQQERNTTKAMMPKESIKPTQNLNNGKERPNISVTQENISVSVTGKKARKKKHGTCSVCGEFIPIPRTHFMKVHLPTPFISFQTACPQEVDKEKAMVLSQSLDYLKHLILGSKGNLSELTGELNAKKWINYSEKYVHPKYRRPMTQFCNIQKWIVPEFFSINPLNTNAGLLHWRALEGCYKFLDRKKVDDFIAYSNRLAKTQGDPELSKLFCVTPGPVAKHKNEEKKKQGTNKTSKTDKISKGKQTVPAATTKTYTNSQSNQGSKSMETIKARNENQKIEVPQKVRPGKKAADQSSKKNMPNNKKKETIKTNIGKLMVQVDVELAPSKPNKKSTDNIASQHHEHGGEVQIDEHGEEGVDIDLEGDFIILEEVSEYSEERKKDEDDTCSNELSELFVVVEEVNDEDAQLEVNDKNDGNTPPEKATENSAEVFDALKNAHDKDSEKEKNNRDNIYTENEAVIPTSKSIVAGAVPKVPDVGSDVKAGEVGKIPETKDTVKKHSNSEINSNQKEKSLNIVAKDSETKKVDIKDGKESNAKLVEGDTERFSICEVIIENKESEPSEMIVKSNAREQKNLEKGTHKNPALSSSKTVKPKDSPLTSKTNPSSQVSKGLKGNLKSTQKTNLDVRGNSEEVEKTFNVYLDPSKYPTIMPYSKIMSSVGVAPQWASHFMDHLELFENLSRNKSIIALGPVGLDYTQPVFTWQDQEEVFRAALDYCSVKKVLILNLQGGDRLGASSYSKGLDTVAENCGSKQPVLLRNFSGTNEDALSWSSQFKNCYFELNPNRNNLSDVLKSIPDNRIILDMDKVKREPGTGTDAFSDVILMSLGKDARSTANKILANIMANELQICVDEVMSKCYENKCRLFSLAV